MHSGLKEFFSVLGCNFFQILNTPLIPKPKKPQNLATAVFSALPSISNDFRCVKPPACDKLFAQALHVHCCASISTKTARH